tara:strand:+ start:4446 stop:4658 length:213 start_codon:yes stop_codon:yes gene_type:complete
VNTVAVVVFEEEIGPVIVLLESFLVGPGLDIIFPEESYQVNTYDGVGFPEITFQEIVCILSPLQSAADPF